MRPWNVSLPYYTTMEGTSLYKRMDPFAPQTADLPLRLQKKGAAKIIGV